MNLEELDPIINHLRKERLSYDCCWYRCFKIQEHRCHSQWRWQHPCQTFWCPPCRWWAAGIGRLHQEDFRASNHPYGAHQPLPLSTPESLHGGGTPSLSDQSIPDEEVWRYRTQKGENGQTWFSANRSVCPWEVLFADSLHSSGPEVWRSPFSVQAIQSEDINPNCCQSSAAQPSGWNNARHYDHSSS